MITRPALISPIIGLVPTNIQLIEQDMGEASISLSIAISADIDPSFSNDGSWAINYNGETYTLKTFSPPGKKDNTSLRYHYDLTFTSERDDLKRYLFSTFIQLADGSLQIFSQTLPFVADISQFIDRFNQNLRYNFGSRWRMEVHPSLPMPTDMVTVQANNASIWAVLTQIFDLYGVRWHIEPIAGQMVIRVGWPSVEISHIFDYGDGLISIERSNPSEDIYTRLFGRGGTRNIPQWYYKDSREGFDGDPDYNPNLDTGYFANLLPTSTRRYVQGWNEAESGGALDPPSDYPEFYNMGFDDQRSGRNMYLPNYAQSRQEITDKQGIREGVLEDNDQIFPSIQGVWLGNLGRADEIVAVEAVLNDDYEEPELGNSAETTFLVDAVATKTTMRVNSSQPATWSDSVSTEMFTIIQEGYGIRMVVTGRSDSDIYPVSDYSGTAIIDLLDSSGTISATASPILEQVGAILTNTVIFENIPAGDYSLRLSTQMSYNGPERRGYPWIAVELGSVRSYIPSQVSSTDYKPTFDIWIKDIWQGESGSIRDIWEKKIASRELTVMFSDGILAGEDYEFVVAKGPNGNPDLPDSGGNWYIWEDTSKSITTQAEGGGITTIQSRWRLSLIKSDAELQASGKQIPNIRQNAKSGDHFFFINIELPRQYVQWAELRLQQYLETELHKVEEVYPAFAIKPSPIFCAKFNEVNILRAGAKIRIRNQRLIGDSYTPIFISSLTMRWPDDGKMLPDWDIVVSDKLVGNKSPIALLQGEIKRLSIGTHGGGGSDADTIRAMERIFLRKDGLPDVSYSPTTFTRDITFGAQAISNDFKQGDFGGTGWGFYDDTNEASVLEVDKLVVRRQMRVNEILVNQIMFTGGKQVYSGAGGTIERVEENINSNSWRCYIDTKMGSLMNHFQVGDQAYHQDFDAASDELLRYYWRLVVRVGEDWIDLSKEDADGTSIPQAGDNIAALGNRTDTSRQSALVIDMVRDGGGLVTWYDAISSYSLVAKDTVNIGRINGQTWVQAYGNAYFGRRDEGRYFRVVDGQVTIRGALAVSAADPNITDFVIVNRGDYDEESVYAQGDRVNEPTSGNYYVYINSTPGAGHPVTSADYWRLDSTTSEAESMYTWVKYSDYKNPTDSQIYDRPEDTPTGNASWIGQAYNKPTPIESSIAADYVWLPFLNTDGRDGDSYEIIFKQTADSQVPTPPVEQIPAQQQDDWCPGLGTAYNYGWVDTFPGVTRAMPYCWAAERKKIAGTWTQFSPAKIFSKYGEDGHGQEWSYYRTTTGQAPSTRPPSSGWTDNPQGVNAQYGWEWESTRTYENEVWGAWSSPTIHSTFSREGTSIKMAYCRYASQPGYPSWYSGSSQSSVSPMYTAPYYWSSAPPPDPADQPLWVSTAQTVQDINGQWSATSLTAPVRLNGPSGLQGRSLIYQGEYVGGKAYTATAQTAAVVKRNGIFYYTTIRPTGTVSDITPPNTTYWTQFVGSFENIATNVLYAESGVLGDFTFSGSARTFTSQDGRLVLNSNTGGITATGGTIGGFTINTDSLGTISQGIVLRPDVIRLYDPTGSTSLAEFSAYAESSGFFTTHGSALWSNDTALSIQTRKNGDIGIKTQVGRGNTAIHMFTGMITGFAVNCKVISGNTTMTIPATLSFNANADTDATYLSFTNTANKTINLPSPSSAQLGRVIMVRSKTSTLTVSGTIHNGLNAVTSQNLARGDIGMFVNDGVHWNYNYLPRQSS